MLAVGQMTGSRAKAVQVFGHQSTRCSPVGQVGTLEARHFRGYENYNRELVAKDE